MLEEMPTKRCMEFGAGSNSHPMTKNQLQWLTKAITNASNVVALAMCMSNQEQFTTISLKLDSIFVFVLKATPKKDVM